jgi:hypothetical protein
MARGGSRDALVSGEADLSATFSSLASSASHRAPGFLEMSVIQSRPRSRTATARPNSALSANLDGIEDVYEDMDVEGEEVLPDASFFSGRSANQHFCSTMHRKPQTIFHLILELNLTSWTNFHLGIVECCLVCVYLCVYVCMSSDGAHTGPAEVELCTSSSDHIASSQSPILILQICI